jgi:hypothetical protein
LVGDSLGFATASGFAADTLERIGAGVVVSEGQNETLPTILLDQNSREPERKVQPKDSRLFPSDKVSKRLQASVTASPRVRQIFRLATTLNPQGIPINNTARDPDFLPRILCTAKVNAVDLARVIRYMHNQSPAMKIARLLLKASP